MPRWLLGAALLWSWGAAAQGKPADAPPSPAAIPVEVPAPQPLQRQPAGQSILPSIAEGSGATREEAITNALVAAQEQVAGVTVVNRPLLAREARVIVSDRTDTVTVTEEVRQAMMRVSSGYLRSYRVLEVRRGEDGRLVARVEAEVAVFRPTDSVAETRRRIAVSDFRDQAGRRTEFGEQLRERLVQHLAQSRRFAVLDRNNDAAYQREMALLATDAPAAERLRIGQVLGADFLVVGRMRAVGAVRTESYQSLTGEVVRSAFARGNLDFQVLEIASRQVRWAGTIAVGTTDTLNSVLERMVTRLGREITQTIYPLRLVRADSPGELIANQGGVTVQVGQRFRVMQEGEELIDPYTRESLGRAEREVGLIEIYRVDDRVSYARLVAGTLPSSAADAVLRMAAEAAPPSRPRPLPNRTGPGEAPRLPFN